MLNVKTHSIDSMQQIVHEHGIMKFQQQKQAF